MGGVIKYKPDQPGKPVYLDQSGWEAGTLEQTYNVKELLNIPDASQLNWVFKDVNADFEDAGGKITHPNPEEVKVSFQIAPGASTYQLVGSRR